ncbi:hypothetical protein FZEAL_10232 [Fusarium zealandicum]|uniref:Uncharacterized protein n=1 Tax=Fusarium zealandicum TaxID=1053134 RepID=A0A8H4U472_9HYPO|nr:hypothetical protein FZEAL_10232 [Fusarium zealandicum]
MCTSSEIVSPAPTSHSGRHSSGHSALPPDYETTEGVELTRLSQSSSSTRSPPQYAALYGDVSSSSSADPSGFQPTKLLQIQALGTQLFSLPGPPRPDPICVYNVAPTGEIDQAEYVSVRPTARSGSCFLARADDTAQTPICTTTYRFGPGRPPKMCLVGGDAAQDDSTVDGEEFEINGKGVLTRSVKMRTHLGTFEWRYGARAERRAVEASVGEDVNNLLVFDQVTNVALNGGKQEKRRRKVGQFVRSDGTRTPGTRKDAAGNGGRLMLDLREWADRKGEAGQMEILAVASCVTMLKREIDRRRSNQIVGLTVGTGAC